MANEGINQFLDANLGQQAAKAIAAAAPPVTESPTVTKSLPGPIPAPKPANKGASKERLQAVAQGGKAGLEAYDVAQKAIEAERARALTNAATRAALIGGPEAQGFEAIAEGEFSRRLADLARSRATAATAAGMRGTAHEQFMKELAAAKPIAEAAARAKGTKAGAGSRRQAVTDFLTSALGQAEIDERTAASSIEKITGELTTLDEQDRKALEGVAGAQKRVDDINKRIEKIKKETVELAKAPALEGVGPRSTTKKLYAEMDKLIQERHGLLKQTRAAGEPTKARREALNKALGEYEAVTPETRAERARGLAVKGGIPEAEVFGKLGAEDVPVSRQAPKTDQQLATKARVPVASLPKLRKDPTYGEVSKDIAGYVRSGVTAEEFEAALRTEDGLYNADGTFKSDLFSVIMAQFAPLLPTVSETTRLTKYQAEAE